MFWLVYQTDAGTFIVLQPASDVIYARLRAALADLAEGTFIESHELETKMAKKIPKNLIGRRLTQDEALALLNRLES